MISDQEYEFDPCMELMTVEVLNDWLIILTRAIDAHKNSDPTIVKQLEHLRFITEGVKFKIQSHIDAFVKDELQR